MFEFLALMFGGAVSDTMKRNTAIDRAKAEGRPYYFYNGKTYSIATGERLESIGRSLRGAYSHEMVYDAAAEELRRTNEWLKRNGKKFHYERDFKNKYHHEKTGYIKIDNSNGKQFIIEVDHSFFDPFKEKEYVLHYVDRTTGEFIGEPKIMTFCETRFWE